MPDKRGPRCLRSARFPACPLGRDPNRKERPLAWSRVFPNFGPGLCTYTLKINPMLRAAFFVLSVSAWFALLAQTEVPLAELTGEGSQQWMVIGTVATAGPCKTGDASYAFQAEPAQVVVQECAGGKWKSRTEAITTWSTSGKSGIAFGGAKYEVKTLPSSAPACKGNAHCVRLTTVPDGKTDATRTVYLTY